MFNLKGQSKILTQDLTFFSLKTVLERLFGREKDAVNTTQIRHRIGSVRKIELTKVSLITSMKARQIVTPKLSKFSNMSCSAKFY